MQVISNNPSAQPSSKRITDDDDIVLSSIFGRMFCCAANVNTANTYTFDETEAWVDRCNTNKKVVDGTTSNGKSNMESTILKMKSKYLASLTSAKKHSMNHIRPYSDRFAATPLRFDVDESDRRLCHSVPLVDDDDDDDILSEISFNGTVATASICSEYSESNCQTVALYEEDSVGSCIVLQYSNIDTRDDDANENEKENIDPSIKDLDTMVEEGLVIAHGPSMEEKNKHHHLVSQKRLAQKKKLLISNDDDEEREGAAVFNPPSIELARVFSSASISHDIEHADDIVAEVDKERTDDDDDCDTDENSIIDPVITTASPTRLNRFTFYNRTDFSYYQHRNERSIETIPRRSVPLKAIQCHF